MSESSWRHIISHPSQLGGIETSVLDNGPGRGTRIAWINTGAGLRFKVVIDRALDIADAFFQQHGLAFISHLGVAAPQPFARHGVEWLSTFGGGLLTTCGLYHFGPPENDAHGERGLHGLISNQPAEVQSIRQPDPARGDMEMHITATVRETKLFGPSLVLRRTISATLGAPVIRLHDEVTNIGNTQQPHMLLYHCNFGWPLVEPGARLLWKGHWQSGGGDSDKIFREGNDFRACPEPSDDHRGDGEAVAFIDPAADASGNCSCGVHNERLGIAVGLRFNRNQLPCLTNWQHWGENEYVTGLEPGTNPPVGQAQAREEGKLMFLAPGETRAYDLAFEVFSDPAAIQEFVNQHT